MELHQNQDIFLRTSYSALLMNYGKSSNILMHNNSNKWNKQMVIKLTKFGPFSKFRGLMPAQLLRYHDRHQMACARLLRCIVKAGPLIGDVCSVMLSCAWDRGNWLLPVDTIKENRSNTGCDTSVKFKWLRFLFLKDCMGIYLYWQGSDFLNSGCKLSLGKVTYPSNVPTSHF